MLRQPSLNMRGGSGESLHSAAAMGNTSALRQMLRTSTGALIESRINALNMKKLMPLALAAEAGHKACVSILINCGAKCHVDGAAFSAMTAAAKGGQDEIIRLMLDKGFVADNNSFIAASMGNYHKCLTAMLERSRIGISESGTSRMFFGITALSVAVQKGFYESVLALLSYGADSNYRDHRTGMTVWMMAEERLSATKDPKYERILELLVRNGAVEPNSEETKEIFAVRLVQRLLRGKLARKRAAKEREGREQQRMQRHRSYRESLRSSQVPGCASNGVSPSQGGAALLPPPPKMVRPGEDGYEEYMQWRDKNMRFARATGRHQSGRNRLAPIAHHRLAIEDGTAGGGLQEEEEGRGVHEGRGEAVGQEGEGGEPGGGGPAPVAGHTRAPSARVGHSRAPSGRSSAGVRQSRAASGRSSAGGRPSRVGSGRSSATDPGYDSRYSPLPKTGRHSSLGLGQREMEGGGAGRHLPELREEKSAPELPSLRPRRGYRAPVPHRQQRRRGLASGRRSVIELPVLAPKIARPIYVPERLNPGRGASEGRPRQQRRGDREGRGKTAPSPGSAGSRAGVVV